MVFILLNNGLSIAINSYHFASLRITLETYSLFTPVWKLVFLGVHYEILHCLLLFGFLLLSLNARVDINTQGSLEALTLLLPRVINFWNISFTRYHGGLCHIFLTGFGPLRSVLFIRVAIWILFNLSFGWVLCKAMLLLAQTLSWLWFEVKCVHNIWILGLW